MNYKRIYLDNAATTPLRAEAADAMRDAVTFGEFNPSSLHAEGRDARAALEAAREHVADAVGARRKEIVFTSSGTEADNLALVGLMSAIGRPAHVVASAIEHQAVLSSLAYLRALGHQITLLPVDNAGLVRPAEFAAALRPDTAVASIMYANNEIGTVQSIAELAAIAAKRNVIFHTDAVAAAAWIPIDVKRLGTDLLSLSAHKFGGPKGVGALYVREGLALQPVIHGGGQEFGKRAGTENLAGIAGMARALEVSVSEMPATVTRIAALRDRLEAGIRSSIADVKFNGAEATRTAGILNVSFGRVESAALLIRLDLAGVAVSAGSACTSGVLEPSHVLAAMPMEARWRTGAIRFSLGYATSTEEIESVLGILPSLVEELRAAPAA